jgi:hypothetical protein
LNRIYSLHDLDDEEILRGVIHSGEGSTLEFRREVPDAISIAKIMSAFANTEGGLILFGIDDNGSVVGIKDINLFNTKVQNAFVQTRPGISGYSSGIVSIGSKPIGCILVWPQHDLPVAVGSQYFRRVGSITLTLNGQEIQQIINDREEPEKLIFPPSEIRKFLGSADEDALVDILLVPVLRKMGFSCVAAKGHKDRSLEYGQDLRGFKFQLPTGHWLYFAAQVKTGNVTYSAKSPSDNIEEILTQVRMAKSKTMFDFETNTYHRPDHVFLIASGTIVEGARSYLCERLSERNSNAILFWDSNLMIERSESIGLPKGIQVEISNYLKNKNSV